MQIAESVIFNVGEGLQYQSVVLHMVPSGYVSRIRTHDTLGEIQGEYYKTLDGAYKGWSGRVANLLGKNKKDGKGIFIQTGKNTLRPKNQTNLDSLERRHKPLLCLLFRQFRRKGFIMEKQFNVVDGIVTVSCVNVKGIFRIAIDINDKNYKEIFSNVQEIAVESYKEAIQVIQDNKWKVDLVYMIDKYGLGAEGSQ